MFLYFLMQVLYNVLTKRVKSFTSNNSPASLSKVPRLVLPIWLTSFNQLEAQIQVENFDVLRVLPPQIHLDEEIIQEYDKLLKKHMYKRPPYE